MVSPRLVRLTLTGPELEGFTCDEPAASVRLLLPADDGALVMPEWAGNEFLLPDGRRATIRTLTPRYLRTDPIELDVDVVLHGDGPLSRWAERAEPGAVAAISGPGRGYAIDAKAPAYLLAGDETAVPAISQLLEALPDGRAVQVHVEATSPDARHDLPRHAGANVKWHVNDPEAAPGDALVAAVRAADLIVGTPVWVAGEAAAVQQIRRHLFEERAWLRSDASVRGYWKQGRTEGSGM